MGLKLNVLQGAHQRAHGLYRAHRNDTDKSVVENRRPLFFFEDHIKIRKNSAIFLFSFGAHETSDA